MDEVVFLLTVSCDQKPIVTRSQPPQEGGTGMTMRKQKGQGAASNHAITKTMRNETGEHTSSFIGERHPSVVWSQSATY